MAAAGTDPRAATTGVRPSVAKRSTGMPTWLLVAIVMLAGLLLFLILDGRRRALMAPTTRERVVDSDGAPPPIAPLFIPPEPVVVATPAPIVVAPAPMPSPTPRRQPAPAPSIVYVPPPIVPVPPLQPVQHGRGTVNGTPVLVFDSTSGDGSVASTGSTATGNGNASIGAMAPAEAVRARAATLRNRATTVVQGTLIPAVLESALDSTRPGPARALVTRDVRGFDGSRVLIPRGSRLTGEYRADLQPGQNRALVIWTRLVRPDGATIALASPAADTLGRAGIKGQVNSHFFERFASALLQTSLNVGTGLAARAAGGDSIAVLTLPGTFGGATPQITTNQIQRTLRVRQGVSISVFAARDLDFTSVEGRP